MDESLNNNYAGLCGTLASKPVFSHISRGEVFYTFPLEVMRLSGAVDRINVIARKKLLDTLEPAESEKLCVVGELRSFNNKSGEGARLVISVFAKDITFFGGDDMNEVRLRGTLCKKPVLRTTPLGRDICDLMLAVNRRYSRSDYLPCITWGPNARLSSEWDTGTVIALSGRIQSRGYIKVVDNEAVEKTAFEVSVTELEEVN